ncbi:MAG: HAMP domain-containing histidine kinase [Muribaculaceae bacterium]|nr:HAMP domain-containing histidine kinase [Muribaculaceae bacterium]
MILKKPDIARYWTLLFLLATVCVVGLFLYVSNNLVRDLARQERERMQIWADATKEIISISESDNPEAANVEFLFTIIERNHTIPVLLVNDEDIILDHRNFDLPEPIDSLNPGFLSDINTRFLHSKLEGLKGGQNVIHIIVSPNNLQHLYYEDSKLLKRLAYYPYIQLLIMLTFIGVVYYAVSSTKRAEQNKVWVGLSKETAHQLGTPISSLMGWMEVLQAEGVNPDYVKEMNKDVNRLSTIASRFSKIGSAPTLELDDLNALVEHATEYMSGRISNRISLTAKLSSEPLPTMVSAPLFEWVMENLIKNAVDAMDGSGSITVTTGRRGQWAVIHVKDTGKGIPRKNFKTVFSPGFTTKKRGWGLGLTLARRIVNQYHDGKIFVLDSEPGVGTTFAIELPLAD